MNCLATTLLIGMLGCLVVSSQERLSRKITLPEAVHLALAQNPRVQIAALNADLAKERRRQSLADLLPQASIGASEGVLRTNIETSLGIPGAFPSRHIGPFPVFAAGGRFNAPLLSFRLVRQYQAEGEKWSASLATAQEAREQMVALTVGQYLLSLRLGATVTALESQVGVARRLYDQACNQERSGTATGLDTLRAQQRLRVREQALIVAREEEQVSRFVLVRLLNLPPGTELTLDDADGFKDRTGPDVDELALRRAWQQHPEMRALQHHLRAAYRELDAARAEHLPTISVNGVWDEQGSRPNRIMPVYHYQVSVSVPVFTGGRTRSESAALMLRIRQLESEEQDLRGRIALEVKTAVAKLQAGLQELVVADSGLDLAQRELSQARDRFEAGITDSVEVAAALDVVSRAYDDQLGVLYRVNQARADLLRATGCIEQAYSK